MISLGVTKAVDYNDPNWIEQVQEWMLGVIFIYLILFIELTKNPPLNLLGS